MSEVLERFLLAAKKYEWQRQRTWKVVVFLFMVFLMLPGFFSLRYFPYVVSSMVSLGLYGFASFCASALTSLVVLILYVFFLWRDGAYAELQSIGERTSNALPLFRQYHYLLAVQLVLFPLLLRVSVSHYCGPPDSIATCKLLVVGVCFAVPYLLYVRWGLSSPEDLAVYTLALFVNTTRDMCKEDPVLRRFYRKLFIILFPWGCATGAFLFIPLVSCEQAAALARAIEWELGPTTTSRDLWRQLLFIRYFYEIYKDYVWLTHFWVLITIVLVLHAIIVHKIDRCLFRR